MRILVGSVDIFILIEHTCHFRIFDIKKLCLLSMCLSEQRVNASLCNVNWWVFTLTTVRVLCAVGP
jgi:hypothetical protein